MATTFARLCQQVDQTQRELEAEIRQLTAKIDQLETVQSESKSLRSVRRLLSLGAVWRVEMWSRWMFWNSGKMILLDEMNDATETAEMSILAVIFLFVAPDL